MCPVEIPVNVVWCRLARAAHGSLCVLLIELDGAEEKSRISCELFLRTSELERAPRRE